MTAITVTYPRKGQIQAVWNLLDGGTPKEGVPLDAPRWPIKSVQVAGTFGVSGSVTIEGSNDGSNWDPLTDTEGNEATFTAAGLVQLLENPGYIRPSLTAGDGDTDLDITIVGTVSGAVYDESALAFISAMTTPPTTERKVAIDTFVRALKASGVWPRMDLIYLTAAHDEQAARLNLKNPALYSLINVGDGPDFTADSDFTGNGTTEALSTQYIPSVDGNNYTQDDASLWVWCNSDVAENAADCGAAVTQNAFIRTRSAGNAISVNLNNAVTTTNAIASSIGFTGVSRADANNQTIWKNGLLLSTAAGASAGLPTNAIRLCGRYNDLFSTKGCSGLAVGGSLTETQALAFYNAFLAYMTSVGNV